MISHIDLLPDNVTRLGRILPCWSEELPAIIEHSRPVTWSTFKHPPVPTTLENEPATKDRIITNINWDVPPVLNHISSLFGLADSLNRLHVQWPEQVWTMHTDRLQNWAPKNPNSVMRIMIQLTDWQPGHFWSYGDHMYQGWHAGDVTTFDWQKVPHSTANAGYLPRVTFQITGIITEQTVTFLKKLSDTNPFQI